MSNAVLEQLETKDDVVEDETLTAWEKQMLQTSLGDTAINILENLEHKSFDKEPKAFSSKKIKLHPSEKINSLSLPNQNVNMEILHELPRRKLVPISQWGFKFSGDSRLSINAFLEYVNELKDSRNAVYDDLWRYSIDLFEGDALI